MPRKVLIYHRAQEQLLEVTANAVIAAQLEGRDADELLHRSAQIVDWFDGIVSRLENDAASPLELGEPVRAILRLYRTSNDRVITDFVAGYQLILAFKYESDLDQAEVKSFQAIDIATH